MCASRRVCALYAAAVSKDDIYVGTLVQWRLPSARITDSVQRPLAPSAGDVNNTYIYIYIYVCIYNTRRFL